MKPAIHVVIASRLFTPEVGAGAFRLQALADGLVAQGAHVSVLTTAPPKSAALAQPVQRGVRVRRFPVLRDSGGNVRGYIQYLSFDIPLFFRLLFTRADLVISEPPPTTGLVVAISSWIRRRPFAYYAADVWTDALTALNASSLLIGIMRRVEGFVLRRASMVLAVSDEVASRLGTFEVSPDKIVVVGNGVNTTLFTLEGPSQEVDTPYFVYTGTMSEWQGADIFVEALTRVHEQHPDARLYFFGQGADQQHLEATASKLALSGVVFGGVIPPQDAATWLRGATAALASIKPGLGYDFAKPTKVYAAAACGTPVIFAGGDASAGVVMVRENDLGYGASYDVDSVAQAMGHSIGAHADGTSESLRRPRATWAEQNASLASVGQKAAVGSLSVLSAS